MSKVKFKTAKWVNGPRLMGELKKIDFECGVQANIFVPNNCTLTNIYDVAEAIRDNIEEANEEAVRNV